jgi:2-methylisocitrate lyase-like PEP mutase family enzyme
MSNTTPAPPGPVHDSRRPSLDAQCRRLRSLHVRGDPLVLPNAWDVASAYEVVWAGYPAVGTTSGGVAATLGYEDHEGAPADEMLAVAARIAKRVDVPVTVDAEAGYGMDPADLVAALHRAGAAGCNLEDSDHGTGSLRDPRRHASWLRQVRDAAAHLAYPLVINARIDVFLSRLGEGSQREHVSAALERARAYVEAGVDCVFPIALWEEDALTSFVSDAGGAVNILAIPRAPSVAELAEIGVARVSYGRLLHQAAMETFRDRLRR